MIECPRCDGTGQVESLVLSGIKSSQCKQCGFQALGSTQVKQFQKRGNLCRECSGDFK